MNHSDFVNEFQAAISKSDNQQIQALEKLLRKFTDEIQSTSITPWHEQQVLGVLSQLHSEQSSFEVVQQAFTDEIAHCQAQVSYWIKALASASVMAAHNAEKAGHHGAAVTLATKGIELLTQEDFNKEENAYFIQMAAKIIETKSNTE